MNRVKVFAPASIANLGAGFDVFGISIDAGGDELVLEASARPGIELHVCGVGADSIPIEPDRNTAGVALRHVLHGRGVRAFLRKGVRPASGLGSSAASAAAAVVAANVLFDLNLSVEELVRCASMGEQASAGTAHRDNVAAAVVGGLTIALDGMIQNLRPPSHLAFAIVSSGRKTNTAEARRVLPPQVPLKALSESLGKAAAFICALIKGDIDEAARCAEESIVDLARAALIPDLKRIREAAKKAGASGVVIAGAGPAVAALVDSRKADPHAVARAIGPGAFVAHPTGGAYVQS
jgi:homoserine kinase